MRYTKQPTDITTQLALLKQRGLIVDDEEKALRQLASISYFRLASYWKTFEIDEKTHQFSNGARLEEIISLYTFDKELRSIIFTAIQDIEVALRTRIIHFFSLPHGAFWFMDASKFNNHNIYQVCIDSIQVELGRSKEEFLQEHFAKYDSPSMPPVWKTLEVVSFGNLSKLYANMKDVEVKKQVAKALDCLNTLIWKVGCVASLYFAIVALIMPVHGIAVTQPCHSCHIDCHLLGLTRSMSAP